MPQDFRHDPHFTEGFADPSPYPKLAVQHPNAAYAALLAEDCSGPAGEITACMQYVYHHTVERDYPDAAAAMEKIAVVEMFHMQELSSAIVLLGGTPDFSVCGRYWCADSVLFGNSLGEALHLDLASEYAAIRNYQRHIRQIEDTGIRALLQRILLDERLHVRIFQALIRQYGV